MKPTKLTKIHPSQDEADSTDEMDQFDIAEDIVKVDKMEQDVEESQQLETHPLKQEIVKVKQEQETLMVKEEPQSEDEGMSDSSLPNVKFEEVNVKKEELEEHYDTEMRNTTSL
ncbi:hypothetical protein L9F63_017467 [Diploptera punctata]|uniref:Uncharacterized protein n=1 Tax=Diploptera punctata TaxID=6984 RepID=A0AAD7ZYZ0_DIPPU|nr:hypothetical protein L9F63_017467 [Diploptera punctata]